MRIVLIIMIITIEKKTIWINELRWKNKLIEYTKQIETKESSLCIVIFFNINLYAYTQITKTITYITLMLKITRT